MKCQFYSESYFAPVPIAISRIFRSSMVSRIVPGFFRKIKRVRMKKCRCACTGSTILRRKENEMIHRYYKEGQKLDVAGLNQITVLIDRSETELTEVALNEWHAHLNGPPHKHDQKEQVFYIVSGEGIVIVGNDKFNVKQGNLIYVPTGVVHQTITTSAEPLGYILFNIFNSKEKEGHASFAEHIEKVKQTRRKQADSGQAKVAGSEQTDSADSQGKFIADVFQGKKYEFGSNDTLLHIDRTETEKFEFVVVRWQPGSKGAMVAHKEKEQTFYILNGSGAVTIGNESENVKPGDIVFVPRNTPHTTETGDEQLTYLCLNSIVDKTQDESFDAMYRRIAPQRMERWKSGDTSVGE
ncbi:cupin domain-containing protein [candidate division KSB1 bacterium]|nr:cupin domain-containing protein [candidate division KSB1 bacterium]